MISTRRGESNCFSRCRPFDCAQGALAKAIALVDATSRVTFATRIAGAILGGFFRDADPSTALRDPGLFWGQLAPRRSRMLSFLFWTGLGGTFLGAGSSFAF